jgi:hypothetical protein
MADKDSPAGGTGMTTRYPAPALLQVQSDGRGLQLCKEFKSLDYAAVKKDLAAN